MSTTDKKLDPITVESLLSEASEKVSAAKDALEKLTPFYGDVDSAFKSAKEIKDNIGKVIALLEKSGKFKRDEV